MSTLQIYDFESNTIRVILRDEPPWFVAADVCRALGIENHRMAVDKLDDDERDDVGLTDASYLVLMRKRPIHRGIRSIPNGVLFSVFAHLACRE